MFGRLKTALYFSLGEHVCGEQLTAPPTCQRPGSKVIKNTAPLTPWLVLEVGDITLCVGPSERHTARIN